MLIHLGSTLECSPGATAFQFQYLIKSLVDGTQKVSQTGESLYNPRLTVSQSHSKNYFKGGRKGLKFYRHRPKLSQLWAFFCYVMNYVFICFSVQSVAQWNYRSIINVWLIFLDTNYTISGRGSEISLQDCCQDSLADGMT